MVSVLPIDDYYSGPIELIEGLLDVTKKAIRAQINWTEKFQVTRCLFSVCFFIDTSLY